MAINLTKGQKVDLTKKDQTYDNIKVGLGWDPVSQSQSGGFFKKLLSAGAPEIDCDASVIMLNEGDKFKNKKDLVYFGSLTSPCGSVKHTGDNLTGEGEGDDEVVLVSLSKIPSNIHKLIFVVNIYSAVQRKQHFGMIQNAFIRIVDMATNKELIRYNLESEFDGKTSLIVGEIYRRESEWKFGAIGQGTNDTTLSSIVNKYK